MQIQVVDRAGILNWRKVRVGEPLFGLRIVAVLLESAEDLAELQAFPGKNWASEMLAYSMRNLPAK